MFQTLHHAASLVGRACTLGCCPDPQTERPSTYVTTHSDATSFLRAVGPWLRADEEVANTILPHSEALSLPIVGVSGTSNIMEDSTNVTTVWFAYWSLPPHQTLQEGGRNASPDNDAFPDERTSRLHLVVMSSTSHLGAMPVFLFSPRGMHGTVDNSFLLSGMMDIAERMAEAIPPERVCSTFGRASLANAFAVAWEAHTGHTKNLVPWKRSRMLSRSSQLEIPVIQGVAEEPVFSKVREVEKGDISTVADICHQFSIDNSPSPLMLEESQAHASHLATSHQAWVYEVQSGQYLGSGVNSAHTGGVVSLCEVGRRSQRVAVITKIFTLPTHRRHGYATRLLSEVMRLLFEAGISTIITYVASDVLYANCIFTQTGFDDCDNEEWVEWGFTGATVSYW